MIKKSNEKLKMNGSFSMLGISHNLKRMKKNGVVKKDINYSSDYSMFKFLDQNRETMDRHIADLAASIKESGQIHAIVVNDKFEIIDGQNRFKACKLLGIPVMYLQNKTASIKDVILMNNTQVGWKMRDYLRCFSNKKHDNYAEYVDVNNFMEEYKLNFSITLYLLSDARSDEYGRVAFKKGTFKVKNMAKAKKMANVLVKIKAFAPDLVLIMRFCMAYFKLSELDRFDVDTSISQLKKYRRKIDGAISYEDYLQRIKETYNFRLIKRNKISYRKEGF
jgi:hypothetical protein|tara:strand:+ start:597 stop:1430 length:834 start_codon:yes stop_codon:yes gene_type:complete